MARSEEGAEAGAEGTVAEGGEGVATVEGTGMGGEIDMVMVVDIGELQSWEVLSGIFARIDGKQYPCYKDLVGIYEFPNFKLFVDKIQGDAYAAPSRFRARVDTSKAGFPKECYSPNLDIKLPVKRKAPGDVEKLPPSLYHVRKTALGDYLSRVFYTYQEEARAKGRQRSGGGGWHGEKGGDLRIEVPGQHVIERNSVVVTNDYVEASLFYRSLDSKDLWDHIYSVEDQEFLRESLSAHGLIGFVRNGAILPRASGVSDRPMSNTKDSKVIPFKSPESLMITLPLLHNKSVSGMAIREGITMIVGGGFHGKSTLLQALERGVYNHVPGDGREYVTVIRDTVKIRAEDGRSVNCVDIHSFINNLPMGKNTYAFSTPDASGSTSQAANIQEALEVGATTLLFDEDTCATNFMIRDQRMRMLVEDSKEPITPLISKINSMATEKGISCVLVIGGSGDYFDVANTVIQMDSYLPYDVTKKAKDICKSIQTAPTVTAAARFEHAAPRLPDTSALRRLEGEKVKTFSSIKGAIGKTELDLTYVEQIVESAQTRCILDTIVAFSKYAARAKNLRQALDLLERDFDNMSSTKNISGLDAVSPWITGSYARPRRYEVAAALNRLRGMRFSIGEEKERS
ncbi:hypothetical protein AAMO2058_000715600 [Amorphochlora amoebiformis]